MTERYVGSPWRSLYLRAPKRALELARRDDFVALFELADIRLGLKSGNDNFFFLTATSKANGARLPVEGLNNWEGEIPKADLLPALRGPKDLDTNDGRRASVPTKRGAYAGTRYYLQPRSNRLDKLVKEYVHFGEAAHVNVTQLVQDNADDPSTWYRQTRNLVRSPIVLQYNSQYNYPATLNTVEAVLNGRLIGVEPQDDVDSIVLAGVLNSTIATMTRLLVGVTTGSEGAIDISPPSAKTMMVPNIRNMSDAQRQAIAKAMKDIVDDGIIPPAPDINGSVADLRRALDVAVLQGLGMTAGQATAFADTLYESYARWRKSVESVEAQMQEHRRALSRRGGSRTASPVSRVSATVWAEMETETPLLFGGLTLGNYDVLNVKFPADTAAPGQDALFDEVVVLDEDGNPIDLGDNRRAELARCLRDLGVTGPLPIPVEGNRCQRLHREIVSALGAATTEAATRARHHVSDDLVEPVVTAVRRKLLVGSQTAMRNVVAPDMASQDLDAADGPSLFDTDGLVPEIST